MLYTFLDALKYTRVYLTFVFIGLASFLINVYSGLNLELLSLIGYFFVIFPVMPFTKVFLSFDLMIVTQDSLIIPSDAAVLLGHLFWCVFFFIVYALYLYKKARGSKALSFRKNKDLNEPLL